MKKKTKPDPDRDTMRAEYDFSNAVRNPYASRLKGSVTAVVLDPDVAAAYPNAKAVNRALRAVIKAAPKRVAAKPRRRSA